jgi:hypothetical protein
MEPREPSQQDLEAALERLFLAEMRDDRGALAAIEDAHREVAGIRSSLMRQGGR